MVTHIARVWINRVRLPILLVVQLNRKNIYFPVRVRAWEFGLARRVRQFRPASACSSHTQAEFGAYLRDSSRVPRRRPFNYFKPSYAIGSVPTLSGHAIAYLWRSLPRVRRHRASKHQGSSERVLPWQVIMDQLICASLSHNHYWYEVGMLKVPAMMWPVDLGTSLRSRAGLAFDRSMADVLCHRSYFSCKESWVGDNNPESIEAALGIYGVRRFDEPFWYWVGAIACRVAYFFVAIWIPVDLSSGLSPWWDPLTLVPLCDHVPDWQPRILRPVYYWVWLRHDRLMSESTTSSTFRWIVLSGLCWRYLRCIMVGSSMSRFQSLTHIIPYVLTTTRLHY